MITLKGEENKLCEDSEVPSPFRAKLFSQRGYLTPTLTPSYSAVEQWPARWAHNPKVGGSNPPSATKLIKVMKYLSKDYVMQEIIDTVHMMQLNNEKTPDLEPTYMDALIEWFFIDWNEIADRDTDFQGCLLEFLRTEFKTETIKHAL